MEQETGENYNRSGLLWYAAALISLFAIGTAIFGVFVLDVSQFLVLAAMVTVSVLAKKHSFTVPNTSANVTAKEPIALWAMIWLGLPGAVLCSAANGLSDIPSSGRPSKQKIYSIAVQIAAGFAATFAYLGILKQISESRGLLIASTDLPFVQIAMVLFAATAVHFVVSFTGNKFNKEESLLRLQPTTPENFGNAALKYLITYLMVIVFHAAFLKFGILFGFVLLAIAFVGDISYKSFARSLSVKTFEISEASRVHMATVEALATAIDARDQVGMGHVRRTQIYAIGIGEILGLPQEDIDALRTGALLHDIGKLAVPDHILNKPGRLTPAEMEKTKIHAAVGASILEKVGFRYPVVPTVKYHHEAWDGTGYPEGLKGNAIPLTARIIAVADAYDTLRGARPYRPAVSREEARKFLLSSSGTQFDPKVVDIFLRNLRQFEAEVDAQGLAYKFDLENQSPTIVPEDGANQSYVEQIKRANREVFTLYELARIFSSSLNLNDTLSLFSKKIGEFVPFDTCAIYLLDESQEYANLIYAEGKYADRMVNKRVKVGEGATGYVLKKRHSVQNINPGLDFSFTQFEFVEEYTSMASLPLITNEKLIGAVSLYSCGLDSYEEEHLRLLETVSRIASDAISKSIQHAKTETHAFTDPMTNLPNARSLQIQFDKEIARASRNGSEVVVLMLDLDGFKLVNDTYGHKVGDRLLLEIARVIKSQLRDYDFLSRYAGDEFVALLPDATRDSVTDLCKRIEKSVADFQLHVAEGKVARVGVSLGAATYPGSGETFDQVMVAADKAMYGVKALRKERLKKIEAKNNPVEVVKPIPVQVQPIIVEPVHEVGEHDIIHDLPNDGFVVELDETHVVTSRPN